MKIVFIISSSFPYGEAFSSRARNFVKLFCMKGNSVHVIAPISNNINNLKELEGLNYSVEYVNDPKSILTLSGFLTWKPYIKALKDYIKNNKVDIIFSSSMIFVANKINKVAKENGIPYIVEQCEWYDESTFKGKRLNPYYREHIKMIEKGYKNFDGIISISRLFEQHYSKQQLPVLRIPTILDVKNTKFRNVDLNRDKIKIVFAGSLGKGKEILSTIFEAIKKINSDNEYIHMDIYGPSKNEIITNINGNITLFNDVKEYISIHGRIAQELIEEKLRDADFSIFIRPERKSSNAGFPTKLAESMSVGTPVITNNTGDVELYLKNEVNGFLLKDYKTETIVRTIRYILNMTKKQKEGMREQARKCAVESFDYKVYKESVQHFFDTCKGGYGK
ncbi:glycosyltransferase family 4 protein [Clostridium perfringens]|uniref:glycosyltransferase family 4 protein n=1 Tax=Clostridium perfringens TaxID=1502 RepID=UPI00040B73D9|nr:glycosyltransferase family 4 protein [Clostridium perfringens]MDM0800783.1 glycosyltransferase family 4 protein [Clostridium perfringens]